MPDAVDPRRWQLGRRPALDGLRAVAAILVIAYHLSAILVPAPYAHLGGGYIGVDMFFVLSGFLITSLLFEEHSRTGHIRVGAFYRRRALRLLPALYLLVAAQVGYLLVTGAAVRPELRALFSIATYWYNWYGGLAGAVNPLGLSHTWSLGVEEQFYLVWPVVLIGLLGLKRRGPVLAAMLGLLIAGAIARAALFSSYSFTVLYWQTESHLDELMIGALAAALLQWGWKPGRWIHAAGWIGIGTIALVVAFGGPHPAVLLRDGGLTIVALAVVGIILATLEPAGLLYWLLTLPALRFIGRISYSLYLWHFLVLSIVATSWPQLSAPTKIVTVLVVSFGCAVISFYAIERPLTALAHRRDRSQPVVPAQPLSELARPLLSLERR